MFKCASLDQIYIHNMHAFDSKESHNIFFRTTEFEMTPSKKVDEGKESDPINTSATVLPYNLQDALVVYHLTTRR